jgi:hypothetical protein
MLAPFRDLLDAPTALAACCGFDLCHKYILYLYLYLYLCMRSLELPPDVPRGAPVPPAGASVAERVPRAGSGVAESADDFVAWNTRVPWCVAVAGALERARVCIKLCAGQLNHA